MLLIAPLFGVLMWLSKERRARLEQLVELSDAYRGTALLLGDVVEARQNLLQRGRSVSLRDDQSSGCTRRQAYDVCGQPCSNTTACGPAPDRT